MNNELSKAVPFWGRNFIFYIYSLLLGMFGGLCYRFALFGINGSVFPLDS